MPHRILSINTKWIPPWWQYKHVYFDLMLWSCLLIMEIFIKFIYLGTILHEILHTLGMMHEHTRMDRDSYIDINITNIKDGSITFSFTIFLFPSLFFPLRFRKIIFTRYIIILLCRSTFCLLGRKRKKYFHLFLFFFSSILRNFFLKAW